MANNMLSEALEIPERATSFLASGVSYQLPKAVPYLGMGSSYFAPLAFRYMNLDILPELASEYYYYLSERTTYANAVILSQSGRSSEALWCTTLFSNFVTITNESNSPLATSNGAHLTVDLMAGEERYSSSKTYINTLLALFKGFSIDASPSMRLIAARFQRYQEIGMQLGDDLFKLLSASRPVGLYITGSGPNIATAMQAALILSETTKQQFTGISLAQYDHGPKETAPGSIVIHILSEGPSRERTISVAATIRAAGATVFFIEEPEVGEPFSILANILPFNFLACRLAQLMQISEPFLVGNKVTQVPSAL